MNAKQILSRERRPLLFDVQPSPTTVVHCDRVRLSCFDDLGRFYIGASADDPALYVENDPPIWLDLPAVDRWAYERAAAAFNDVMDCHERRHAFVRRLAALL